MQPKQQEFIEEYKACTTVELRHIMADTNWAHDESRAFQGRTSADLAPATEIPAFRYLAARYLLRRRNKEQTPHPYLQEPPCGHTSMTPSGRGYICDECAAYLDENYVAAGNQ